MGVMTMKEACEYSKQQQMLRGVEHRRKHRQKSTFSKARKFTHNRMWQETSKNYSVEQLKTIVKS